jgi:hypothetical protein
MRALNPYILERAARKPELHQAEGIAEQRQRDARLDRMPAPSRRTAQLQLPRCGMRWATSFWTRRG